MCQCVTHHYVEGIHYGRSQLWLPQTPNNMDDLPGRRSSMFSREENGKGNLTGMKVTDRWLWWSLQSPVSEPLSPMSDTLHHYPQNLYHSLSIHRSTVYPCIDLTFPYVKITLPTSTDPLCTNHSPTVSVTLHSASSEPLSLYVRTECSDQASPECRVSISRSSTQKLNLKVNDVIHELLHSYEIDLWGSLRFRSVSICSLRRWESTTSII